MSTKQFFLSVMLLVIFMTIAKADPITFNVTSWSYTASNFTDASSWSINAVDANGKALRVSYNSLTNGALTGNVVDLQGFVTGLPYTSSTTSIAVSPGISTGSSLARVLYVLVGTIPQVNIGVSQATAPFTMSGSITTANVAGQSLSFNLLSGTATIFYTLFNGSANTIIIFGTGGTVTINDPAAPIPEPATLLLLGSGLAALGMKAHKRRQ